MLAFLEGNSSVNLCTAHLKRSVGLIICERALFGKTAKQVLVAERREWSCLEGRVEKGSCAAKEKVRDHARCAT